MFEEHLQNTIALVQGNPVIGIGVAVLVVALFYFRPKDMFRAAGILSSPGRRVLFNDVAG